MRSLASYCIVVLTRLSAIHIVIPHTVDLVTRVTRGVFVFGKKQVSVMGVKDTLCQRTANKEYRNLK